MSRFHQPNDNEDGATTVVGEGFNVKDYDLASPAQTHKGKGNASDYLAIPPSLGAPNGNGAIKPPKFGQSGNDADYSPKNGSLFVRIGADGVLAALYKLDRELQNVCWSCSGAGPRIKWLILLVPL